MDNPTKPESAQSTPDKERWLNFDQAVAKFNDMGFTITDRQLRRWRERRLLVFVKMGRGLFIQEKDIESYVEDLKKQAKEERRR